MQNSTIIADIFAVIKPVDELRNNVRTAMANKREKGVKLEGTPVGKKCYHRVGVNDIIPALVFLTSVDKEEADDVLCDYFRSKGKTVKTVDDLVWLCSDTLQMFEEAVKVRNQEVSERKGSAPKEVEEEKSLADLDF